MSNPEQSALEDAIKYLHRRDYSATELSERLEGKYEPTIIQTVLARLEAAGLVSDQRVVDSLLARHRDRKSIGDAKLRKQLSKLGIAEEIIERTMSNEVAPEEARATELVKAKYKTPTPAAKIGRFLYSRGFDESTIESVLDKISWSESE
ncbi:MAG: regulatory protein RecX [Armatimonadota bacterium]